MHMQNLWTCLQHMTGESGISWEREICCKRSCNCFVHALGSSGASRASWLYTLCTESCNWYAKEPNSQGASLGCLQSMLCACSLQTGTPRVFKVLRVQAWLFVFPWGRADILCEGRQGSLLIYLGNIANLYPSLLFFSSSLCQADWRDVF